MFTKLAKNCLQKGRKIGHIKPVLCSFLLKIKSSHRIYGEVVSRNTDEEKVKNKLWNRSRERMILYIHLMKCLFYAMIMIIK